MKKVFSLTWTVLYSFLGFFAFFYTTHARAEIAPRSRTEIKKNEQEAVLYASDNLETLTIEMAQGSGEYLAGFARVMGCDDSVVQNFCQMIQKNYTVIIGAETASGLDIFRRVKERVQSDPILQLSCRASA